MSKKDFDVAKELENLANRMSDDDVLFAIHTNEKKNELDILSRDDDNKDITCTLAAIISTSLVGKGGEGMDKVTDIIIRALRLVLREPLTGLKLSTILSQSMLDELKDALEIDEDEDDFQEDCENCELNRRCNAPEAIEWRKANGIPKPKKGKGFKVEIN